MFMTEIFPGCRMSVEIKVSLEFLTFPRTFKEKAVREKAIDCLNLVTAFDEKRVFKKLVRQFGEGLAIRFSKEGSDD